MDPLITPIQNMIALICAGTVMPITAITIAVVILKQLGWMGFEAFNKEKAKDD
jgi:hypothetical protein